LIDFGGAGEGDIFDDRAELVMALPVLTTGVPVRTPVKATGVTSKVRV